MKQKVAKLISLINDLPRFNIMCYTNELAAIIYEFKSILNIISKTNDVYLPQVNHYRAQIGVIEEHIQAANTTKTELEKDIAYAGAVKALDSGIKEFAASITSIL